MPLKNVWRQPPSTGTEQHAGCNPVALPRFGMMVINHTHQLNFSEVDSIVYTAKCVDGELPTVLNRGETILQVFGYGNQPADSQKIIEVDDDATFTANMRDVSALDGSNENIADDGMEYEKISNVVGAATLFDMGRYSDDISNSTNFDTIAPDPFYMSTFPPLVTLAGGCVLMYVCFVSLLCSRRPLFLQLCALVSVTCFTIIVGVFLHMLKEQNALGYTECKLIVDDISVNTLASVADLIVRASLMMAEIFTLTHLFNRKRERRVIVIAGGILLCTSEAFWGISLFTPLTPDERSDALDAVIVFAYLFSIATDMLFACAIILYSSWSWRVAYRPRLLIIAFFTHASTLLPIVLFIVDLADQYVDSWNDYAKLSGMMAGIVCMWIWADRIDEVERLAEAHSVLGRQQCAEDEDLLFEEAEKKHKEEYLMEVKSTKSSKSSSRPNTGPPQSQLRWRDRENVPQNDEEVESSEENRQRAWDISSFVENGLNHVRAPSRARSAWRNLLDKTPFLRPPTSSSTQTTYDVTYEPETPAPALTVHQHPFKRR